MAAEGVSAGVPVPLDDNILPDDVRDKLAELELELSEGKHQFYSLISSILFISYYFPFLSYFNLKNFSRCGFRFDISFLVCAASCYALGTYRLYSKYDIII
jgi:hypothetical protein